MSFSLLVVAVMSVIRFLRMGVTNSVSSPRILVCEHPIADRSISSL